MEENGEIFTPLHFLLYLKSEVQDFDLRFQSGDQRNDERGCCINIEPGRSDGSRTATPLHRDHKDTFINGCNPTSLYTNMSQEEGTVAVCIAFETFSKNNPPVPSLLLRP